MGAPKKGSTPGKPTSGDAGYKPTKPGTIVHAPCEKHEGKGSTGVEWVNKYTKGTGDR